mmetsp:Transcript_31955/g.79678  ORF Transcript_31955/g.79678 Transcript_31955/m.79678 type:complete len:289 (-) Transcript_31955:1779-2645(-)
MASQLATSAAALLTKREAASSVTATSTAFVGSAAPPAPPRSPSRAARALPCAAWPSCAIAESSNTDSSTRTARPERPSRPDCTRSIRSTPDSSRTPGLEGASRTSADPPPGLTDSWGGSPATSPGASSPGSPGSPGGPASAGGRSPGESPGEWCSAPTSLSSVGSSPAPTRARAPDWVAPTAAAAWSRVSASACTELASRAGSAGSGVSSAFAAAERAPSNGPSASPAPKSACSAANEAEAERAGMCPDCPARLPDSPRIRCAAPGAHSAPSAAATAARLSASRAASS